MNAKRILFTLLAFVLPWLGLVNGLKAQSIENFQPLKAKGPIPESIISLTKAKLEKEKSELEKEKDGLSDAESRFLEESNYQIKRLLQSGRVLFNDPVTSYLQSLADYIVEQNPDISLQNPKIYVVKSPVANAYTVHDNKIFFNIGMVAQVESEAELAFIMCHEFIHVLKDDAMARHKEKAAIESGEEVYEGTSSYQKKLMAENNYSKTQERRADVQGLKLFENTDYPLGAVYDAFSVLKYSYLPFDNIAFKKDFLETEHMIFPESYFLDETQEIKSEPDEDQSTHPNVRKRKRSIEKEIGKQDLSEGAPYQVSKEAFEKAQDLARFEVAGLHLLGRNYPRAIYTTFIMLQEYPDNYYLQNVINKALYNLSMYHNKMDNPNLGDYYKDVEGKSQQVYYLLRKLNKTELNVLATHYAWKMKFKYPDKQFLEKLANNQLKMLVFENDLSVTNFYEKSREKVIAEKKEKFKEKDELSKYEKIEKQKLTDSSNFQDFAFVGLLQKDSFKQRFEDYVEQYEKEELETSTEKAQEELMDDFLEEENNKKIKEKHVKELVSIKPYYYNYNKKDVNENKFIKSEERRVRFNQILEENANRVNLDLTLLDPINFEQSDIERYNHFVMAQTWFIERFKHEDRDWALVSSQNWVNDMLEQNGKRYYHWSWVNNVKKTEDIATACYVFSVIGIPYAIYQFLTPEYDTKYQSMVFDMKKNKLVLFEEKEFGKKDASDILKSFSYNTLYQVSEKID